MGRPRKHERMQTGQRAYRDSRPRYETVGKNRKSKCCQFR
jgi:hypothetical protein